MDSTSKNSLQRLISEQEKQKQETAQYSYYRNQVPATEQEIKEVIACMAANYDRKTIDFWKGLKKILIEEKWSVERLRYAAKRLMYNVKFQTWTIAEFMEMDRTIERMTAAEAENLPDNHRPLAMAKFGDRWQICYKEDAERLGLDHKPWKTNKELNYKVEDID